MDSSVVDLWALGVGCGQQNGKYFKLRHTESEREAGLEGLDTRRSEVEKQPP